MINKKIEELKGRNDLNDSEKGFLGLLEKFVYFDCDYDKTIRHHLFNTLKFNPNEFTEYEIKEQEFELKKHIQKLQGIIPEKIVFDEDYFKPVENKTKKIDMVKYYQIKHYMNDKELEMFTILRDFDFDFERTVKYYFTHMLKKDLNEIYPGTIEKSINKLKEEIDFLIGG